MTDNHESQYRSIANPRRVTLMDISAAEAAAPHKEGPQLHMMGDDAATCIDGVCAIPE
ncbi:hypothetical protein [Antribacter gilvus]|uniref:hypothetical protein n=1 Tax=Antribacter gilvus TaxID=2304675 RepID=UPI0013DEDD2B|nr:hypothetical protein [Antribacter gilvus]